MSRECRHVPKAVADCKHGTEEPFASICRGCGPDYGCEHARDRGFKYPDELIAPYDLAASKAKVAAIRARADAAYHHAPGGSAWRVIVADVPALCDLLDAANARIAELEGTGPPPERVVTVEEMRELLRTEEAPNA